MRLLSILAAALVFTVAEGPGVARPSAPEPMPVYDLRVSLLENVEQPNRKIWQGLGQAGIVQLRQGHVQAVLTMFSAAPGETSDSKLAARFTGFRSALASTKAFEPGRCPAGPGRITTWFELDAPALLAGAPEEALSWTARGVRVFSLATSHDSELSTSAFPSGPARVVGLSEPGRRAVETIMRAGALVDVSGLSDVALLETLELSKQLGVPVIATRASARAVRNRPGSLSDEQLRAIAATGGVVALTFDRDAIGDGTRAELPDVLRQLRHLVRVAGPEAVALASGFESGAIPPAGLGSAARFPRLVEALMADGMPRATVSNVFHDNAARLLCGAKP
ncbi:MAG: membrane dipeptidase [Myxococcales bacterium]